AAAHPLPAGRAQHRAQGGRRRRRGAGARRDVPHPGRAHRPRLAPLPQEARLISMARPRTDIEPRLLRAARERFLADGVDGASLRAIARAAGTSIGMLYYYFPTKDDLFLAVVEEVYSELLADLTGALSVEAPIEERLARLYARFARISQRELEIIRLVVREMLAPSPRLARLIHRFQHGHLPLVQDALAAGLAEGRLDPRFPLSLLLGL